VFVGFSVTAATSECPGFEKTPSFSVGLLDIWNREYDDDNWRKGLKYRDCFRAILSHGFKWFAGERTDPESGCHHLAHVMWNAMVLIEFDMIGRTDLDDRVVKGAPLSPVSNIKEPPQKLKKS